MITLKRILLPTDFSDYSSEATRYACELVDRFKAELHLFHVLETHITPTPAFGGGLALGTYIKESRAAAEKHLAKLLSPEWEKDQCVVRSTADGAPFVEIIRYAKEQEIDLIVIGTHGRTGLAHMMLGSVAEKVVRKAPCPVLTVRPDQHQFVMP